LRSRNAFIAGHAILFPTLRHRVLGAVDRIALRSYLLAAVCASILSITIAVELPRL